MSTTERPPTGLSLLNDLSFAVGVAAVPVLLHAPLWLLLSSVAAAALATRSRSRAAILSAYVAPALFGAWWPTHCLSAAAMWWFVARRSGSGRSSARKPLGVGRTPRRIVGPVSLGPVALGVTAGAVTVLLDRERIVGGGFVFDLLPPPVPTLTAIVVGFSVVNAVGEELLWREVLERTLAIGTTRARYAVQAVTFGVAHWNGIPSGVLGVLASGLFSAVVYRVRERNGLSGAIVVHVATDLVIFGAVARYAVFAWAGFTWTTP